MLNHNTGPASTRLLFSRDGLTNWTRATGPADAFNGTVAFDNGTVLELCQRQRPQVVLDEGDGMPGWLWTGVMVRDQSQPSPCPANDLKPALNPTWTLAQRIYRSPPHR
jgi:hypothetical protein